MITSNMEFALAIVEPATDTYYGDNSQELFETASAIKSAIGTLVIMKAEANDQDIGSYTVDVSNDHYSNGSGILKDLGIFRREHPSGGATMTLRDVLHLNLTESDCIATNALIDYLDGQDGVNKGLEVELGLSSMRLVTDRLHFPGVDHAETPMQVGTATMADFNDYYRTVWDEEGKFLRSPAQLWHKQQHHYTQHHRLLGNGPDAVPAHMRWAHKTGSILDQEPDTFFETFVDAGMLEVDGRRLFVAAAGRMLVEGTLTGNEQTEIESAFVARNTEMLSTFGVTMPLK